MSYWEHAMPPQRSRAVDLAEVAWVAGALLDSGGPSALTVRAVAERLGVAGASLYSRIRVVSDLADLALDAALGDDRALRTALAGADFEAVMLAHYRHLVAHPWACGVIAARAPRGPHYLALSERMVVLLEEAGHPDPLALAYTISNFVIGSATTTSMAPGERAAGVPADAAPRYAAHHAAGTLDPEALLRAGVRALLRAWPSPRG